MNPLLLDLLWRWKWALLAGSLISALVSWGILSDPETSFFARGGNPFGAGELILAGLWGSLLISIDLARGTARVWAALPLRPPAVSLAVWWLSVMTFPLISTFVFTALALYAWLDGGDIHRAALAPLVLLNTTAYAGFAHLLFCESRTWDRPRWRRDSARLGYLLLLGGSYFAISLYPADWDRLGGVQASLIVTGLLAAAVGLPATRSMLASLRGGERRATLTLGRGTSDPARRLARLVRGPLTEGLLLGLLAALVLLAPVALAVWTARRRPEVADRLLSLSGWNPADVGFSLMICLVFGVVFVGFYAAHPWMNALRALRGLPYGPGRVAWTCLQPALVSVLTVLIAISAPMAWLLGPGLRPLLWYVAFLSPPLAVATCAAFLRWGYAVVMAGIFALIPISLAVRRIDSSLLHSPPRVELATSGLLMSLLATALFLLTVVRSPSAYRSKHVPWF